MGVSQFNAISKQLGDFVLTLFARKQGNGLKILVQTLAVDKARFSEVKRRRLVILVILIESLDNFVFSTKSLEK